MTERETTGLTFQECGIAEAIHQRALSVPLNQRPYAWTKEEVQRLFSDVSNAYEDSEGIYFLGMIVLTRGARGQLEVADGQQRLATISILIAAIRDYLLELKDHDAAVKYQSDFLLEYDPRKKDFRPKLHLNFEDHEFFVETILKPPSDRSEYKGQRFTSHELLCEAADLAKRHVRNLTASKAGVSDKCERLYEFVDYLRESTKVIVISVPGYVGNAFKMFETLNARGLPASKVDILKNFLFNKGADRISDVHARWISMLSTIETIGADDFLLSYIRHFWITQHGPTTEAELGGSVERAVRGERQAIDLVMELDASAKDYTALLMPRDDPRWAEFTHDSRNCLYTITRELGVEQIRPLLLAIARKFTTQEAAKAFELCLSWCVRFLIVGGGGGGLLDRHYGLRAMEISKGGITTARMLADHMVDVVPGDAAFTGAFAIASVRRTTLARYYLRAIELYVKGEQKPQFIPSQDITAVNLEHILPVTPSDQWTIPSEVAATYYRRLGNMVLLGAKDNVEIGNKSFEEKKTIFVNSPFEITRKIATYDTWGPDEIDRHQRDIADYAPKVWPI